MKSVLFFKSWTFNNIYVTIMKNCILPENMAKLKMPLFENRSQGGKIRKRSPPVLVWTVNPHTFQNDEAIAPPLDLLPLTSEPRNVS